MNVDQTFQRLQAAEVKQLPLTALTTDVALQPREGRMVPFRARTRVEKRSEEQIGTLRLILEATSGTQLDPVLVADVDGVLLLVDGHHRLAAYRRAKRETLPARVMSMEMSRAVLVSKLVNCTGRALEMHSEQRLDAAWHYLAAVTQRGALKLPEKESYRIVAGRFGIGHNTVSRMIHKLPKVNPRDWSPDALDPGTGFPRWRYVREGSAGWMDMKEKLNVEQITQREAEKLATRIGALMDKASPEAVKLALQMLKIEAQLAVTNEDEQDFLEDTAEDCDENSDESSDF